MKAQRGRPFNPSERDPALGQIAGATRSAAETLALAGVAPTGVPVDDFNSWRVEINRLKVRAPMARVAQEMNPGAGSLSALLPHLRGQEELLMQVADVVLARSFPVDDHPAVRASVCAALTYSVSRLYLATGGMPTTEQVNLLVQSHLHPSASGLTTDYLEPTSRLRVDVGRFEAIASLLEVSGPGSKLLPQEACMPILVEMLDAGVRTLYRAMRARLGVENDDDEALALSSLYGQAGRALVISYRQGYQELVEKLTPMSNDERRSFYMDRLPLPTDFIEKRFERACSLLDTYAVKAFYSSDSNEMRTSP